MSYGKSTLDIQVVGLDEVMQGLKSIDKGLLKELTRGLREDARPLYSAYRQYAGGLGGSGQYASNASMRQVSRGVKISNSDPGAGPIEFANPGAVYLTGPRAGKRMGVPAAPKPRALMRARDEHEDEVIEAAETRIERFIERYLHG